MDIDMEERSSCILPLRTLMDADKGLTVESEKTALSLSEQQPTGKRTRQTRPSKARGPYRRYTAYQIEKLFDLVIEEGKSAKDAALISRNTTMTKRNACLSDAANQQQDVKVS